MEIHTLELEETFLFDVNAYAKGHPNDELSIYVQGEYDKYKAEAIVAKAAFENAKANISK